MNQVTDHFEIEIKSLLGTADKAEALRSQLHARYPSLKQVEDSSQLNHYFVGNDDNLPFLIEKISSHISTKDQQKLQTMIGKARKASVRTRLLNDTVILVIKASIDDTTSSNGIARLEFEATTPDLSIDELDQLVLSAGYEYQAKWSRARQAYQLDNDTTVSIDKNAGYGYLAEFEKVVHSADAADATQTELRELMAELGAAELAQDRLERMFAYYNEHWPEYYGTEKTFSIE
ncbi:MAG TPA: hypothetical protein VD999_01270 [Vitreimonas sp.]|nr:hypothetical protein [Vitreimonas sp.]